MYKIIICLSEQISLQYILENVSVQSGINKRECSVSPELSKMGLNSKVLLCQNRSLTLYPLRTIKWPRRKRSTRLSCEGRKYPLGLRITQSQ